MGTSFYSSTRHSQAKCQKQDCLYKHVSFILSIVIRRTQHTPTHPNTPHTLPCLYILKCLSLRINWRASVNLLIDQVSALVPTLFFVIVTLAQKSAPPFSSWARVSTAVQDIHKPSVKSKTAYINMFPSFSLLSSGGHNTPQHTQHTHTLPCLYILKCLSLRINWRASVNLLIDQVSALVPTLFFVIVIVMTVDK